MKAFRRLCIAAVTLGALLLWREPYSYTSFDTLPFPGAGLSVKMIGEVRAKGDFQVVVGMPATNDDLALGGDTAPCALELRIMKEGEAPYTTEVNSLSQGAEYGFARVQYYYGGHWQLRPGEWTIEVKSRGPCKAAERRGATISVEQILDHVTERFLTGQLRHVFSVICVFGGIAGLIWCEFKKMA